MFTLKVQSNPAGDGGNQSCSATIEVVDETGEVRADVMVEVYEGVPRLVVSPGIVERDSDEVTRVINLLTDEELPT